MEKLCGWIMEKSSESLELGKFLVGKECFII